MVLNVSRQWARPTGMTWPATAGGETVDRE